ncbi:MAG TPA: phage integrase SAM-like domain-containing protein, partial [Bacteroidota bacterium]|nr:phage integrase SAM-like domain-containing protein [Bacteroidota bacterium]
MEYAKQIHSPGNMDVYHRAFSSLLKIVGDVVISSINPRSVDQFKAKRHSHGISKTTLNIELRALRAAFQFAVRWELIPANPFKGVRLFEVEDQTPAFFSVTDFKNLIGHL